MLFYFYCFSKGSLNTRVHKSFYDCRRNTRCRKPTCTRLSPRQSRGYFGPPVQTRGSDLGSFPSAFHRQVVWQAQFHFKRERKIHNKDKWGKKSRGNGGRTGRGGLPNPGSPKRSNAFQRVEKHAGTVQNRDHLVVVHCWRFDL